jgi:hypothetical protein
MSLSKEFALWVLGISLEEGAITRSSVMSAHHSTKPARESVKYSEFIEALKTAMCQTPAGAREWERCVEEARARKEALPVVTQASTITLLSNSGKS